GGDPGSSADATRTCSSGSPISRAWHARAAQCLISRRAAGERLDQAIQVFLAAEKGFHADALVLAMGPHVEDVTRQARVTVRWNARLAQEAPVGGSRRHGG